MITITKKNNNKNNSIKLFLNIFTCRNETAIPESHWVQPVNNLKQFSLSLFFNYGLNEPVCHLLCLVLKFCILVGNSYHYIQLWWSILAQVIKWFECCFHYLSKLSSSIKSMFVLTQPIRQYMMRQSFLESGYNYCQHHRHNLHKSFFLA